jgi:hypothetical protein
MANELSAEELEILAQMEAEEAAKSGIVATHFGDDEAVQDHNISDFRGAHDIGGNTVLQPNRIRGDGAFPTMQARNGNPINVYDTKRETVIVKGLSITGH